MSTISSYPSNLTKYCIHKETTQQGVTGKTFTDTEKIKNKINKTKKLYPFSDWDCHNGNPAIITRQHKRTYASINVKPEGGDPGHMWGIWPLLPSPPSGIWLRIWVPGWERLLFLHGGMGPSHIVPLLVCGGHLLTTHFQYKLMEHFTLWGVCGLLIMSIRFLSGNRALEFY